MERSRTAASGGEHASSGQGRVVGVIGGHNRSRSHRSADKRESWPGEGDRRTTRRLYGPTIDKGDDRRSSMGLGSELREMERALQERFSPTRWEGGLVARLGRLLSGGALSDELRRVQLRHRSEVVDEFGFDPKLADRLEPLLRFLYHSYFRVELRGQANLPSSGRALLVANHSGALPMDAAMLMIGVFNEHEAHRLVRPLVEDFIYHAPVLGTLARRLGAVRANFENGQRLLARGRVAAVFPEGIQGVSKTYGQRYRLQRFGRGGFVKLALRTRSPIIPVAVVGAEDAYPLLYRFRGLARSTGVPFLPVTPTFPLLGPLGLLPLPSRWVIQIGGPIYIHESFGSSEQSDRVVINRVAEQVRATIQSMVDDCLAHRGPAFFG